MIKTGAEMVRKLEEKDREGKTWPQYLEDPLVRGYIKGLVKDMEAMERMAMRMILEEAGAKLDDLP